MTEPDAPSEPRPPARPEAAREGQAPPPPMQVIVRRGATGAGTSLGPLPFRLGLAVVVAVSMIGVALYQGAPRRRGPAPDAAHQPPSAAARAAVYEGRGAMVFDNYRPAALGGDVDAMKILADHCRDGDGVNVDLKGASEWYEKAAAAGDAGARYELSRLHAACCEERARAWLREAAEMGDEQALAALSRPGERAEGAESAEDDAADLAAVLASQGRQIDTLYAEWRSLQVALAEKQGYDFDEATFEELFGPDKLKRMLMTDEQVDELAAAMSGGDVAARDLLAKEVDRRGEKIRSIERGVENTRRQLEDR